MTVSKSTIRDLAIFGGGPAFASSLYVNQPNLGDRDTFLARLDGMLDRRWFTNHGPLVVELEVQLTRYLGVKHCVVTCNGTVALGLVGRALELGGEVIVPSFTFVATAHALLWQGIEPVFCDIDPKTWNIDPARCEELMTERTTAIVGVHLWGRPCDTQGLEEIARRHDVRLVFDAAHAFGCSHRHAMLGRFGDAEVFSFHATKVFHTFEGGAVATNNDELAERVRSLRNFGFTGYDEVATLGTNAKMPEASAAMGLANLGSLETIIEENRRNYAAYQQGLEDVPGLRLLRYDEQETPNYHYVVLEVDEEEAGLSRDHLLNILHAENVVARRYFYPGCHRLEPYASRWPEADGRLPNTNRVAQRVLVLPAGTGVTRPQIRDICALLRLVVSEGDAVRRALTSHGSQGSPYTTSARVAPQAPAQITTPRQAVPKLELRVSISPDDANLRMIRYLLESLQEFGGPIGRAAHCVASVGADEPPRDLARENSWTADHSIEFQWLDRELFRRLSYDGTGLHRFHIESDADVVALVDADLLIAGDFDRVILEAFRDQVLLGAVAHISPFGSPNMAHISSDQWWNMIFEEAGLPKPRLGWEYTAWGLEWGDTGFELISRDPNIRRFVGSGLISRDSRQRRCPAYLNYGFVIAPRTFVERMGETYEAEMEFVDQTLRRQLGDGAENVFKSQIANCLAFDRHGIPCRTFPFNYNFPLNLPGDAFRALNPDPDGQDSDEDVKIFHYISGREHFETPEAVQDLLSRSDLTGAWSVFQRKLRIVDDRIASRSC